METSKIKILKFLTSFDIGGTERHVINLLRGLDRSKFDVSLACLRKQGPFLKDIERLDIAIEEYRIDTFRSRKAFRELLRCARWIRANGVHIVHTYGFYSNVFGIPAAKLGGASYTIASIRDMLDLPPAQSAVHKLVGRFADAIFVNADAIRQRLIARGYNGAKIKVVKNGVDLSRFARKNESGRLRQEFGLYPTAPVIVVLSRLSEIKGVDYFLEAAATVAKRFEEARSASSSGGASFSPASALMCRRFFPRPPYPCCRRMPKGCRTRSWKRWPWGCPSSRPPSAAIPN